MQLVTPLLLLALVAPVSPFEGECPCDGLAEHADVEDDCADEGCESEGCESEDEDGNCPEDCHQCRCCSAVGPFVAADAIGVVPASTVRMSRASDAAGRVPDVDRHGVFRPPRA